MTSGQAAELTDLPFDATLGGELVPWSTPQLKVDWKLAMKQSGEGRKKLTFSAAAKDAALSASGSIAPNSDVVQWQVNEGKIQLGTWFGAIAQRYFPKASDTSVAGFLSITGSGTSSKALAEYTGALALTLVGASFGNPTDAWSLSQVTGKIELVRLPNLQSAPRQRIEFASGTIGQIELKHGQVEFTIESSSRIQVHVLSLETLGGRISVEPFAIDLEKGAASARVTVDGVDLGQLRAYLPKSLSDAQGKLDGHVQLNWSSAAGLKFGAGDLRLRKNAPASIRLAPAPGFLSSRVPAEFRLLPDWRWLGPLSRAFTSKVPAHDALVSIEMGNEALIVESVEADLNPAETTNDSTARVVIIARPRSTDVVKRVRLSVNVSGPLADVVRFGLDGRLSFGK